MVSQIAITGSANSSVSSAQGSASAGSGFTDLLQSMVQSPSARPAHAAGSADRTSQSDSTSAHSSTETNKPGSADPGSGTRASAGQPEVPADSEQTTRPESTAPGTEAASQKPSSASAADVAKKPDDEDGTEPLAKDDPQKDDDDPLAGLTLLAVIPAAVAPAVVPVNPETPEVVKQDATSALAPPATDPRGGTCIPVISAGAETNAGATKIGAEAAVPENAAPAAQDSMSAEANSDEVSGAVAGKANLSAAKEGKATADEPADKHHAELAQTAIQDRVVNDRATQNLVAHDANTTRAANAAETANAPVQAVANPGTQTQSPSAGTKAEVQATAQKAPATQGARAMFDRSRERVSSREADAELSTRPDSKADAQSTTALADQNAVPVTQAGKGSESTLHQDATILSAASADQSQRANDNRGAEVRAGSSLQQAASEARPTVQAPDQTASMNSARLIERISQSEMRVGIQSDLGDIAVRTAMNRHELSAEISVQHAGLRDAIVAEIPALQSRLSAQQIPMNHVSVSADAGGGANSFQQSAQDGRPSAHYPAAGNNQDSSVKEREPAVPVEVIGRSTGLDIRI